MAFLLVLAVAAWVSPARAGEAPVFATYDEWDAAQDGAWDAWVDGRCAEARAVWRAGEDLGVAEAALRLGWTWLNEGCPGAPDLARARAKFTLAADHGEADAAMYAAIMTARGLGGPVDRNAARRHVMDTAALLSLSGAEELMGAYMRALKDLAGPAGLDEPSRAPSRAPVTAPPTFPVSQRSLALLRFSRVTQDSWPTRKISSSRLERQSFQFRMF